MNEQIKKEAEELVGRFYHITEPVSLDNKRKAWEFSIRCAIICCERMINELESGSMPNIERAEHYMKLIEYIQTKM